MLSYLAKANSLSFSESTYSIDEDGGSVEIQLILSNSTMSDVIIEVLSVGGSANGEHWIYNPMVYRVVGKVGRGRFGEFGESSMIHQIKTIQICTYN